MIDYLFELTQSSLVNWLGTKHCSIKFVTIRIRCLILRSNLTSTGEKVMIQTSTEIQEIQEQIVRQSVFLDRLNEACREVIVGQEAMMQSLLIGLLTKGHVLLEGMPGLAKTLAIKTLASAVNGSFSRIQFTPDLLPADLIGTMIFDPVSRKFEVRKGPVFANFILADEINRAPAKVQSALLEAMQERQVTIGDTSFPLEEPFIVLATQNPIEQEGTYSLPEAQLDRFMLKVKLDYPSKEDELEILRRNLKIQPDARLSNQVISNEDILGARSLIDKIYLDPRIEQYILDIVFATRYPENLKLDDLKSLILYGASPRASIFLATGAKAHAFIQKRAFVLPEDVRAIFMEVMRHRVGLTFEAEAREINIESILQTILNAVEIP
jgi:MoxR-like ATPase